MGIGLILYINGILLHSILFGPIQTVRLYSLLAFVVECIWTLHLSISLCRPSSLSLSVSFDIYSMLYSSFFCIPFHVMHSVWICVRVTGKRNQILIDIRKKARTNGRLPLYAKSINHFPTFIPKRVEQTNTHTLSHSHAHTHSVFTDI